MAKAKSKQQQRIEKRRKKVSPKREVTPPRVDEQPQGKSPVRLLTRREVCERVHLTYPTIWKRMREGTFPRAREMPGAHGPHQDAYWLEHEIDEFILGLPVRRYLGEMVPTGSGGNVRIKGSPHWSTIEKEGAKV